MVTDDFRAALHCFRSATRQGIARRKGYPGNLRQKAGRLGTARRTGKGEDQKSLLLGLSINVKLTS